MLGVSRKEVGSPEQQSANARPAPRILTASLVSVNCPDIVIPNPAAQSRYIIMYKKNGVQYPLAN